MRGKITIFNLSDKILCFLSILLFSINTFAGTTGKLAGKVTDSSTKEALLGANVIIVGTTMGAATDTEGDYFIINVPPGTYSLKFSMVGYASLVISDVVVNVDRTTNLDAKLESQSITSQEVHVIAERPVIRKDMTASIVEFTAREIELSPQRNIQELIKQQRGVLLGYNNMGKQGFYYTDTPSDALHIRGGRENETLFTLNGITVNDPMWGGSEYIQLSSGNFISEFNTLAGTFNAEYGNAMSGAVNIATENGASDHYAGKISLFTDQFGIDKYDQNTLQGDFAIGGPVILPNLTFYASGERRVSDGYLYGYVYPNWTDSRGKAIDSLTQLPLGTGEKTSMDKFDYWNASFKLNWSIIQTVKLSGFVGYYKLRKDSYNNTFKYFPAGNPYQNSEEYIYNLTFTHALSSSTYYEIGAARQNHKRFLGVYDSWSKYMQTPEEYDPSGSFFVIGEEWQWHNEKSDVTSGRAAIVSQLNKTNLIKLGANFRGIDINFESKNPNEAGSYYMNYDHKPFEMSAFLQDKMEFSDIGLIINLGVRYDLWDANAPYWTDINKLFEMKTAAAEKKTRFSPRLGVSYPITDQAAFHFAYGHFYQLPPYYLLYQGQRYLVPTDKNWDSYPGYQGKLYIPFTQDNAFRLGNSNLNPERTDSYEAGVQMKLTEDVSIDITAYYREMSDLVGERFIAKANSGNGLRVTGNYDYGNAKGIELSLNKRFSNYFSIKANYTFSKALVTSSTPWAQLQIENPTFKTFTADWDRPHTFNFDLYVGLPASWDISLSGNFQSGMPYTIKTEPNTERAPFISSVDTRFSKTFDVLGFRPKVYLNVLNLLDRKNVYGVYPSSGKPDLPLGVPRTLHNLDVYDLPNNYSAGRQIYLGAEINL
ncbi:MAG TPA: TonB-dependent receptor [Ignavibacteriaceae bacterium]|nr:TonB-dependent receptor [Ignavibacteriaceae bacterium]